jgi:chromate transporter
MIYLNLFWAFVQIGFLSFGGGHAAIPLIQTYAVERYGWLTQAQFADLVAIAEMTPGPFVINSATFVGIQVGGISGALIATLGFLIPPFLVTLTLAFLYYRFNKSNVVNSILKALRPAVTGLIAAAGLTLILLAFWHTSDFSFRLKDADWVAVGIFAAGFFVLRKYKPNPALVMLGAGLIGLITYLIGL